MKFIKIVPILLLFNILLVFNFAQAGCTPSPPLNDPICSGALTREACNALLSYGCTFNADAPGGTVQISNPLGNRETSPQQLIGRVIQAVLGISGSLALLMFVYGGFTWMLSSGNSEKVTKGKNTLVWASIGLVVIFSSYALVKFIFDSLGGG